jgi:hypothetical protein
VFLRGGYYHICTQEILLDFRRAAVTTQGRGSVSSKLSGLAGSNPQELRQVRRKRAFCFGASGVESKPDGDLR